MRTVVVTPRDMIMELDRRIEACGTARVNFTMPEALILQNQVMIMEALRVLLSKAE